MEMTFLGKWCLKGMGGEMLSEVMSTELFTTAPDDPVSSVLPMFEEHTGLPVLDSNGRLIGVVSRRDVRNIEATVSGPLHNIVLMKCL